MATQLSDWIHGKFGRAISIEEANHLIFALFLSVSCLPADLRSRTWDRAALTSEFARLVLEGFILNADASHGKPEYWSSAIDQMLIDQNEFDSEFWERLYERREA